MQKVIVVGAGFIGRTHMEAWTRMKNAQLAAVVDQNGDVGREAAALFGAPYYATLQEAMQQEDATIADVCLPTFLHEACVLEAAAAGKHVLCEKPVTFELDSFDRMADACAHSGVRFMTAQVVRWDPAYAHIADMLRAGEFGAVRTVCTRRLSQHPGWSSWFRDPKKSGGGLYDLHVHDLDYVYSLFGMPCRVYASGWKSPDGCWNHICTELAWENGQTALCESSIAMTGAFPFTVEARINGERGTVDYAFSAGHNLHDGVAAARFQWYPADGEPAQLAPAKADMYEAELSAFADAVETGAEPPIPPAQTRQVLRIVLGVRASLESGMPVRF